MRLQPGHGDLVNPCHEFSVFNHERESACGSSWFYLNLLGALRIAFRCSSRMEEATSRRQQRRRSSLRALCGLPAMFPVCQASMPSVRGGEVEEITGKIVCPDEALTLADALRFYANASKRNHRRRSRGGNRIWPTTSSGRRRALLRAAGRGPDTATAETKTPAYPGHTGRRAQSRKASNECTNSIPA